MSVERRFHCYRIRNIVNGMSYIGITTNPNNTKRQHLTGRSPSRYLSKAIQQYGRDQFEFALLNRGMRRIEADLFQTEAIITLNTIHPAGYNLTRTGHRGGRWTDESRRRRCGGGNGRAKLTQRQVEAIRSDQRSRKEIAKDYSIHVNRVRAIRSGRRWGHLNRIKNESGDNDGERGETS